MLRPFPDGIFLGGSGAVISNRVVDAIGDISGGIRLHDTCEATMQIFHGREKSAKSESRGPTFTGQVWADPVMPTTEGVTINNVFFTPGARTFWHTHAQGQVLQVTAGKGWICVEGQKAQAIRAGDTVWIPANERHWHGAAADSYLLHTAISLGKADWQDEVVEADYARATA